jgi:capsule polysaccharide export protein KpsE/RkpR
MASIAGVMLSFLPQPQFTAATTFVASKPVDTSLPASARSVLAVDILEGVGLSGQTDQYASLMRTARIEDGLVERFDLAEVYGVRSRDDARKKLDDRTDIDGNRNDGLVRVAVRDTNPTRAASLANGFVQALGELIDRLSLDEARARKAFFGPLVAQAAQRSAEALAALRDSRVAEGALRTSPLASAQAYAQAQARADAARAGLEALRASRTDADPAVRGQEALVHALEAELARLERPPAGSADYVERYREFVYQQTIHTLLQRQYDAAQADVARSGPPIRVVDVARPPEHRAWPRRGVFGLGIALVATSAAVVLVLCQAQLAAAQERVRSREQGPELPH